MIHVIDSTIGQNRKVMYKTVDFLKKHNIPFKLYITTKATGEWAQYNTRNINPEIIKGIIKFYDYDISKICRSSTSSTTIYLRKLHPKAYRIFSSSRIYDMKLSELTNFLIENPYFLKTTIVYNDRNGIVADSIKEGGLHALIPRDKKVAVRETYRPKAFEHIANENTEED